MRLLLSQFAFPWTVSLSCLVTANSSLAAQNSSSIFSWTLSLLAPPCSLNKHSSPPSSSSLGLRASLSPSVTFPQCNNPPSPLVHVLPKCGALPIHLLGRVWYPEGPTTLLDSRPWSDVSALRQTENTLNRRTSLHSHSRIWLSLLWFCPGRVIISNHKIHVHCVENIHPSLAEFNPVVWRWFDCPHQLVMKFNTQRKKC